MSFGPKKTIAAVKPDRAPLKVLTDITDGVHFPRRDYTCIGCKSGWVAYGRVHRLPDGSSWVCKGTPENRGDDVDVADIIAGALPTSRGHAYSLMASALRESGYYKVEELNEDI